MVQLSTDTTALLTTPRIAYFSMEIALSGAIPTYSGGLGILSGDTIRTAADMELPVVAVTLVSRQGFFRQGIDAQGNQTESPDPWEPADYAQLLRATVAVPIEGCDVWIHAWLYPLWGRLGGCVPVIFLDTDCGSNTEEDRRLTDVLYGGDPDYRLKQEIILGIGGARILRALGVEVERYHMNEGHSALLAWDLLGYYAYPPESVRPGESPYNFSRVRRLCVFTTHTSVESAHDQFSYELVLRLFGHQVDLALLKSLAGQDRLNMTRLALNLSEYINGVAERHAELSNHRFPGYRVRAITNGVHPYTWTGEPFQRLYDRYLEGWAHEPELLRRATYIPSEAIRAAHTEAKADLIHLLEANCGVALDPELPILGFARRMTAYKRPDLLFTDLNRLQAIAEKRPFQVVLSGKAHPRDESGKRLIRQIHGHIRELQDSVRMVFMPDYDMRVALTLIAGTDIWLNTPMPPWEASGTSGMKAAFNGVPSLSIWDGWWIEGGIEGVTGWVVGDGRNGHSHDDAENLYRQLEEKVLPLYYEAPEGWVEVMKGAISFNASAFNTYRMMRRYATEAYLG